MFNMWLVLIVAALSFACGGSPTTPSATSQPPGQQPPTPASQPFLIINQSGVLDQELDLLVDTNLQLRSWVSNLPDSLQAAYPSGQQWGFIGAVLRGSTTLGSRPGRDVSGYKTLQLDLRGAAGGETVQIGIKDNTDPDDGTETRKTETLSTNWQTFTYTLTDFRTADLTRVYLLFEVVFNGTAGRTIFVRNVRYVP